MKEKKIKIHLKNANKRCISRIAKESLKKFSEIIDKDKFLLEKAI